MEKLNRQNISEFDRYYNPKPEIVKTLPPAKSVRDFSEVFIQNPDKTYRSYKMVDGKWIKIASNLSDTAVISKATQSQVVSGANDTNYITPEKVAYISDLPLGLFEFDVNGDSMPISSVRGKQFVLDGFGDIEPDAGTIYESIDDFYELDSNNDIMPKA